jgi:hypothetical protein
MSISKIIFCSSITCNIHHIGTGVIFGFPPRYPKCGSSKISADLIESAVFQNYVLRQHIQQNFVLSEFHYQAI